MRFRLKKKEILKINRKKGTQIKKSGIGIKLCKSVNVNFHLYKILVKSIWVHVYNLTCAKIGEYRDTYSFLRLY